MSHKNSASFNSLISSKARLGLINDAISLLSRMMASNLDLTSFSLVPILSSPSFSHHHANLLHPLILKAGLLHSDSYTSTALLSCLTRNRRLGDAIRLFDEMPMRTVVTWNSLITCFAQMGYVEDSLYYFRELLRSRILPSECSFIGVLSALDSSDLLCFLNQLHGFIIKRSMNFFIDVVNSLLNAYCNCAGVQLGEQLFKELLVWDVVSWNTMVTAFAKSEVPNRALDLFFAMPLNGFMANEATFCSAFGACTKLKESLYGKLIHAKAIKCNLTKAPSVGNPLVHFYAVSVGLADAHRLFDEMPERSVILWNSLISGWSLNPLSAIKEMLCSDIRPNERTFSSSLKHTSQCELQQIHSLVTKMGFERNIYVLNSLISCYTSQGILSDPMFLESSLSPEASCITTNVLASIYNKSGRYDETKRLFLKNKKFDNVSWNMLFTACVRKGDFVEAFQFFKKMQHIRFSLDNYMAVSLLTICSRSNRLMLGKSLHGLLIKSELGHLDTFVCNVLLDMYAKCGSLNDALQVFDEITDRSLISWTAMISALGQHGYGCEALSQFERMKELGFRPDRVTLLAVLLACTHEGLVEEGMKLFENMEGTYGIVPDMDHYVRVVDLLCKSGRIKDADVLIRCMPFQPCAAIWRTFLKGCERFGLNSTNTPLAHNL
ncbi:hypothetical protein LUZ63_013926 [Rhynchospora breviuscula]|uniref:Pentatricopeptide repeat-containing protein n=1 Tax=Rhynchospora breviuscula TaxID=2022672 RepID=A0A9Q0HKN9_9POAL|nr:hypothetical protein LUZ63_013926 [Rhynchospora breviuscula]